MSFEAIEIFHKKILLARDHHRCPVVLVGNKSDLREYQQITAKEGEKMAEEWGGYPFFETCAIEGVNAQACACFRELVREIKKQKHWDEVAEVLHRKRNWIRGQINLKQEKKESKMILKFCCLFIFNICIM